ncbi:hypothetical protein VTI74DRAFT_1275 [Chaetomium olivicolor]
MESTDSVAGDANEVTWQVAFFALMPLALGAMTQPASSQRPAGAEFLATIVTPGLPSRHA